MATTGVQEAGTLPRFIVIKSKPHTDKGHAYFKADGGSVLIGEEDVFSTLVKIEAERSTINDKYVHLRFDYFNRYWQRSGNSNFIVGESDQPEEDETKSSCTLFEPVKVNDSGAFYLRHVQSGGRVSVDGTTMALYVDEGAGAGDDDDDSYHLSFVDWNTLVKLPANVAFKGDNGMYIVTFGLSLMFLSDDPNISQSSFTVELKPDGHVQIGTLLIPEFYWSVNQYSEVELYEPTSTEHVEFWPVKIDENSIALRSAYNNNFCCRFNNEAFQDTLFAAATTITKEAILQVQESVLERKIYNVVYQMEYARIFNEEPFLAGTTTLVNDGDVEGSIAATVTYEDQKSYTFSHSLSLTAGITTSIEAGLLFIEKATVTVSYSISGTFEWDNTTTTTTSVTATGAVNVPAKSTATVDYIGTKGTCNVPYSYTQEDRSSTTGEISYTDVSDGIYTGVNYYNFYFHIRDTQPL